MGLPSSLCGGDSVCRCGEPAYENVALTRIIVGASLLAKAVCHSTWMYLIWRLREQAHSYRGAVFSFSASTNAANAAEPWRRFG